MQRQELKLWLRHLVEHLYKHFNIAIAWKALGESQDTCPHDEQMIEKLETRARDRELLLLRRRTLQWNEDSVLEIAPGQRDRPFSITSVNFASESSFPNDGYFNPGIPLTHYLIAGSEIRRKDRRKLPLITFSIKLLQF